MGRRSGLAEAKILAVSDYESSPNFSETERLVLRYTDQLTRTPVHVDDDLFAALRDRFDEAQLVELTAAIAWENYRARFNHAFAIESEGFSEGAVCALPVVVNRPE